MQQTHQCVNNSNVTTWVQMQMQKHRGCGIRKTKRSRPRARLLYSGFIATPKRNDGDHECEVALPRSQTKKKGVAKTKSMALSVFREESYVSPVFKTLAMIRPRSRWASSSRTRTRTRRGGQRSCTCICGERREITEVPDRQWRGRRREEVDGEWRDATRWKFFFFFFFCCHKVYY